MSLSSKVEMNFFGKTILGLKILPEYASFLHVEFMICSAHS